MTERLKMYWSKSPKKRRNLGNLEQTVLRSAAVLNPYRNISSKIYNFNIKNIFFYIYK